MWEERGECVKAYRFGTTIWQAAGGWLANGRVPRGKRGHYTIRVGYPVPVLRAPAGRSISAHSVPLLVNNTCPSPSSQLDE